ncbi:MBL fold metallo-hydrolase [Cellulomonas denverensis]|uniref:MBL fold metallo-hydrolase n=1 Tax=Cellulomonas denverensis TaxID=264297 RepID=UPI0035E7943F
MTTITSWGHACLSFDRDDTRLVIDPGGFSDLSVLAAADAILVTHDHVDHLAVDEVVAALSARPGLEVWGPESVATVLTGAGVSADRVYAVADGEALTVAGFPVRVLGREHRLIHPDVPRPENVGYLVDERWFHPRRRADRARGGRPGAVRAGGGAVAQAGRGDRLRAGGASGGGGADPRRDPVRAGPGTRRPTGGRSGWGDRVPPTDPGGAGGPELSRPPGRRVALP